MNAKARRNADKFGTSIGARVGEETAARLAATSTEWSKPPRRENENDEAVHRLAKALKGRFVRVPMTGWDSPLHYSPELLAKMLGEAMCHGDPVRIAAMAAVIFARRLDQQVIAQHAMREFLRGSCQDQAHRIAELEAELAKLKEAA